MWKLKVLPNAVFAYYCINKRNLRVDRWRKPNRIGEDLSINSGRKMKRCIQWLIACSDYKKSWETKKNAYVDYRVNHATLTFHENMQNDDKAREILSNWIDTAKYRWNMRQYVWKAEPQERGAIHFHLTSNVYIPHKELNYTWNRAQRKAGLYNVNGNGTDIHAVTEELNLLDYFSNYLTDKEKHEGRRKIGGRLWGSSRDLTEAGRGYIAVADDEMIVIENDLREYDLRSKIISEGREPPDFLRLVNYWMIKPEKFGPEVRHLFEMELQGLKLSQSKKQLELWERV